MPYSIADAASLIAEFDPALAALYVRSPFQRRNVVKVFMEQAAPIMGEKLSASVEATLLIAAEFANGRPYGLGLSPETA